MKLKQVMLAVLSAASLSLVLLLSIFMTRQGEENMQQNEAYVNNNEIVQENCEELPPYCGEYNEDRFIWGFADSSFSVEEMAAIVNSDYASLRVVSETVTRQGLEYRINNNSDDIINFGDTWIYTKDDERWVRLGDDPKRGGLDGPQMGIFPSISWLQETTFDFLVSQVTLPEGEYRIVMRVHADGVHPNDGFLIADGFTLD